MLFIVYLRRHRPAQRGAAVPPHYAFQTSALLATDVVTTQDRVLLPLQHVYPLVTGLLLPLGLGLPLSGVELHIGA